MKFVIALVWPAVIIGILYWLRNDIPRLFRALVDRVEKGDSFEAGGIKLGSSRPRLPADVPSASESPPLAKAGADPGPPHELYLLHKFTRDNSLDKNGRVYYRLNIWVESDGVDLSSIVSITYHLHESFDNPIRVVTDHLNAFALSTAGWGSFLLFADVSFSDDNKWRIERYLNF